MHIPNISNEAVFELVTDIMDWSSEWNSYNSELVNDGFVGVKPKDITVLIGELEEKFNVKYKEQRGNMD